MATTNQTIESLIKVTLDEAMKEVDEDSRKAMDPLLSASMAKHFGPYRCPATRPATATAQTRQVTTLVPGPQVEWRQLLRQ